MSDIIGAHAFSSNHKKELVRDEVCGCFHCLAIFSPREIVNWLRDTEGTALCPYCGIDSVLGESSGFPITAEFLEKMQAYWFAIQE